MNENLPSSLAAFEAKARERLSTADWDYLMGGMGPGGVGAANVEAWARLKLRPRVLRGVEAADTSTTALGAPLAMPLFIAPNGRATRYHPDGEAAVLTAARAQGAGALAASSVASSIKPLRALAPGALTWSQFYMTRDRSVLRERVAMAVAAGCSAVVLTADLVPDTTRTPLPRVAPAAWETPSADEPAPIYAAASLDDLAWLCEVSTAPVVVKGVLRGDDAAACVDAGAKALIVSNHGGNQLSGAITSAEALIEVVQAIGGRAEVYVDGGIRSGADVVKAIALGARAVMIGRPISHGLAVAGAEGAGACLSIVRAELERTMLLCGARTLSELTHDLIA